MGGTFKRMYRKTSVGGVVTMPEPLELTISAFSAVLGAPIATGSLRYYGIYYRDALTPPCPASSNFNIGNQVAVCWIP